MNENDDLFESVDDIFDIDSSISDFLDDSLFPDYAELDDIFDVDTSVERATAFSLAQENAGSDTFLLESDDYDIDVFEDFISEAQSRGLGLQKHKVIDKSYPDAIGRSKEYSMFISRWNKILEEINTTKKMNKRGTLLVEELVSLIDTNAIRIIHNNTFKEEEAKGKELFPTRLSRIFSKMFYSGEWNPERVYEDALAVLAADKRRLSDADKVQLRKEIDILTKHAHLILTREKGRPVYNRPEIDNIAVFFSPESLICECGGRSDVQFDLPIVPLTAMVVTTLRNKKHHVVVANPPYRCRDCGEYICLPEIFVDNVEQAIKEMIQEMKINFKGIAFYRPNLQELMQRLPPELTSLLKDEKHIFDEEDFHLPEKSAESDDYLNLYKTLIKRFAGETKSYIDFVDFETFVASVVQTLETYSIFTLSYEIYVLEDERRMTLEQTLLWMKNNLARIASIKYFTRRITLEEVLPPVLSLLRKVYNLRYLADHGNFKKPLVSMKVVSREKPRTEVPYAALWDYYTYLQLLGAGEVSGLSITDYYWSDEEKLFLTRPMSHKYGYDEYKQLLLSGHTWKGFESEYFNTANLGVYFELKTSLEQDYKKFLTANLYPLPMYVASPYIEKDICLRLVAAHKIARLIETGDESQIGEACFLMRDATSYMDIVRMLLADTSFVEESLPLRVENRGLFNELDNDSV